MADQTKRVMRLHVALGHKPLNRTWAKLEILIGLFGTGAGLLLSQWSFSRREELEWTTLAAALLLFVLGGYLALAGSRSHLYQSNNELTSLLLEEIHRLQNKG